MCRRSAVVALVVCAWSARAVAQEVSLEAHARAVAASYANMDAVYAVARADSVLTWKLPVARRYAGMDVHVDTTQVPAAFLATLDDAFSALLRDALALFGPGAHGLLTGMRLTITRGTSGEHVVDRAYSRYLTLRTEPFGRRGFAYQTADAAEPNFDVLRSLFVNWFGDAAVTGMPAPIRSWLGQSRLLRDDWTPSARGTYRTIARTNSRSARACIEGVLRACRSLLAIEANNDTTGSWLDAGERRAELVRLQSQRYGLSRYFFTDAGKALYNRCAGVGNDSACREAMRMMRTAAPVNSEGRAALVHLAIQVGGAEAYARLQGARSNDVGSILETTAGMPLDALLRRWHSAIISAKSATPRPNTHELVTSLAFCAVALLACTARRP